MLNCCRAGQIPRGTQFLPGCAAVPQLRQSWTSDPALHVLLPTAGSCDRLGSSEHSLRAAGAVVGQVPPGGSAGRFYLFSRRIREHPSQSQHARHRRPYRSRPLHGPCLQQGSTESDPGQRENPAVSCCSPSGCFPDPLAGHCKCFFLSVLWFSGVFQHSSAGVFLTLLTAFLTKTLSTS